MTVAKSVADHLSRMGIAYSVVRHTHAECSDRTAEAAHVSGEQLAKGVLLKDNRGYLLAVLPTTHALETGTLGEIVRRPLTLASESEIARVFADCEVGAVPVTGGAYGLPMVVERRLYELDEVYFEGGDHESLVRVSSDAFHRLMDGALLAAFSHHKG